MAGYVIGALGVFVAACSLLYSVVRNRRGDRIIAAQEANRLRQAEIKAVVEKVLTQVTPSNGVRTAEHVERAAELIEALKRESDNNFRAMRLDLARLARAFGFHLRQVDVTRERLGLDPEPRLSEVEEVARAEWEEEC